MYSGNYRAPHLDYRSPGIYMITLVKKEEIPDFSEIIENDGRFHSDTKAIAVHSKIGENIRFAFEDFHNKFKSLDFWQIAIMPNHIHFILNINTRLDEHLGRYIARLKLFIREKIVRKGFLPASTESIFELGFNDQYLSRKRSLQDLFDYVKFNPDGWWERWKHPENFRRIQNLSICNRECRLYGNLSILRNPCIYPVIVHRRYSEQELNYYRNIWRYAIYNGGVLVSAFIHDKEKEIKDEALEAGGKIIYLGFFPENPKWKPHKELFDHCKKGKMLMISPNDLIKFKQAGKEEKISRPECLYLNDLAERISDGNIFC